MKNILKKKKKKKIRKKNTEEPKSKVKIEICKTK